LPRVGFAIVPTLALALALAFIFVTTRFELKAYLGAPEPMVYVQAAQGCSVCCIAEVLCIETVREEEHNQLPCR